MRGTAREHGIHWQCRDDVAGAGYTYSSACRIRLRQDDFAGRIAALLAPLGVLCRPSIYCVSFLLRRSVFTLSKTPSEVRARGKLAKIEADFALKNFLVCRGHKIKKSYKLKLF